MSRFTDLPSTLAMLATPVGRWLGRCLRKLVLVSGVFGLCLVLLACTRIPFDVHRWLGMADRPCAAPADLIVVLGGSGMPSGPELLRLHCAAQLAMNLPTADLLVIHPDTAEAMRQMVDELVLRGVGRGRIAQLSRGENTREQALEFWLSRDGTVPRVALVTAPENMRRSVLAFQEVGVRSICGAAAWDHAMDHHFAYQHDRIGGKTWTPDLAEATTMRYTFWNYLKLEVGCLREFAALAYYWLNGWI